MTEPDWTDQLPQAIEESAVAMLMLDRDLNVTLANRAAASCSTFATMHGKARRASISCRIIGETFSSDS